MTKGTGILKWQLAILEFMRISLPWEHAWAKEWPRSRKLQSRSRSLYLLLIRYFANSNHNTFSVTRHTFEYRDLVNRLWFTILAYIPKFYISSFTFFGRLLKRKLIYRDRVFAIAIVEFRDRDRLAIFWTNGKHRSRSRKKDRDRDRRSKDRRSLMPCAWRYVRHSKLTYVFLLDLSHVNCIKLSFKHN